MKFKEMNALQKLGAVFAVIFLGAVGVSLCCLLIVSIWWLIYKIAFSM